MTVIVAFTGRKGNGKDTAAKPLIERGFVQARFAQPLKEMLATFLRYQHVDEETIQEMIEGRLKEQPSDLFGGQSPRHAMVTLGTEWGRDLIHPDLWAETLDRYVQAFDRVVVTDLRFLNEEEVIRRHDGVIIRIVNPRVKAMSNHPSETEQDFILADVTFLNDGTIETLHNRVIEYLEQEGVL